MKRSKYDRLKSKALEKTVTKMLKTDEKYEKLKEIFNKNKKK